METLKPFLVFSFGLMRYLDSLGFKFFATKQDRENPTKTIYIYTNTVELQNAVLNYKNNKEN